MAYWLLITTKITHTSNLFAFLSTGILILNPRVFSRHYIGAPDLKCVFPFLCVSWQVQSRAPNSLWAENPHHSLPTLRHWKTGQNASSWSICIEPFQSHYTICKQGKAWREQNLRSNIVNLHRPFNKCFSNGYPASHLTQRI